MRGSFFTDTCSENTTSTQLAMRFTISTSKLQCQPGSISHPRSPTRYTASTRHPLSFTNVLRPRNPEKAVSQSGCPSTSLGSNPFPALTSSSQGLSQLPSWESPNMAINLALCGRWTGKSCAISPRLFLRWAAKQNGVANEGF